MCFWSEIHFIHQIHHLVDSVGVALSMLAVVCRTCPRRRETPPGWASSHDLPYRDRGDSAKGAQLVERLEEHDHLSSLCCIGHTPSPGPQIVRHMLRIAGAGDHCGHRLAIAERRRCQAC
jgi:hypothetical protein